MSIIAFKLIGDYAHFSHPATIYSSLTYPIPPKTAIMGFLGAVIGEEEHYKLRDIKYCTKKILNKNKLLADNLKSQTSKEILKNYKAEELNDLFVPAIILDKKLKKYHSERSNF